MSRRDGIENLLTGAPSEIAPTATGVRDQTAALPGAQLAATPKPPRVETAKAPDRKAQNLESDRVLEKSRSSIRFQVSAPVGSQIEQALLGLLTDVPQPLRSSLNIGTLFRQIMIENDAEIATIIRKSMREY